MAGFLHESNTFLGIPTEYEDFLAVTLTRGQALIERWRGANHEIGGFVDGLAGAGIEIVPLLATLAIPSGTISAQCYERIASELLEDLSAALPLDGLLLALHGATVSEEFPDADGELLRRVRERTGPKLPIITTLDLHANVSPQMIELADATVVYRSNPHLDQRERGLEAALLMARTLRGEIRPVQAAEMPAMLIHISKQHTAEGPAFALYQSVQEVLAWPGILSASIAMGFYYADVQEMGVSLVAVADNDLELARRAAQHMAARVWSLRDDLTGELPSPADAVRAALASTEAPIAFMDVGDNVGAGSPANSTVLIREVINQNGRDAMVILHEPEAIQACLAKGPGQTIRLTVGEPKITIEGVIRSLSDGRFVERKVRHGGWGACDQGITAVVETAEGHTFVLTTRRMAPMSLEQVLSLGIKPELKKILIVKGVVAPRAAYEPVSARIVLVDTPGVTSDNPRHFEYKHRRSPLFPLD